MKHRVLLGCAILLGVAIPLGFTRHRTAAVADEGSPDPETQRVQVDLPQHPSVQVALEIIAREAGLTIVAPMQGPAETLNSVEGGRLSVAQCCAAVSAAMGWSMKVEGRRIIFSTKPPPSPADKKGSPIAPERRQVAQFVHALTEDQRSALRKGGLLDLQGVTEKASQQILDLSRRYLGREIDAGQGHGTVLVGVFWGPTLQVWSGSDLVSALPLPVRDRIKQHLPYMKVRYDRESGTAHPITD